MIADIGYFNITIKNENIEILDATGVNIKELKNNSWNIGWGLNVWNGIYACRDNKKPRLIIKPANGTVTEGSWECKVLYRDGCHLDRWTKAHIYEKDGYLMHETVLRNSGCYHCDSFPLSIGCRKTTGKF